MPCDDCSRAEKCPPCVNDSGSAPGEERTFSTETRCDSCSHTVIWHDNRRIPPCTHLVEGHDCNCLGFEEPGDEAAKAAEPFEHTGPAGPLLPGTKEAVAKAFDKAFSFKAAKPLCPHEEWEVISERRQGEDTIWQRRRCQGCDKEWTVSTVDPDSEAACTGCAHESWEVLNQWPQDKLRRSGSKWYKYRRCATCGETLDPLLEDEPEHLDIYGDDPVCPCRECQEAANEAPEGAQAAPEAPSRPPLAVVYRIAGEGFYEVLVPGDAVVSVQDGVLAISHPDRPVTGLMQVRPHGEAS